MLDMDHMVNGVTFLKNSDEVLVAQVPYQEQYVFSHVRDAYFQSAMSADKIHAEIFCCTRKYSCSQMLCSAWIALMMFAVAFSAT
jgi:hypothetical protein